MHADRRAARPGGGGGGGSGALAFVLAKAAPSEAARSWRGKRRVAADRAAVQVDGATGIRLPRGRRLSVHSFHLHH